jgi:hypothetical protein
LIDGFDRHTVFEMRKGRRRREREAEKERRTEE